MALNSATVDVYFPDVSNHDFKNRTEISKIFCKRTARSTALPIIWIIFAALPWTVMPIVLKDS